MSVVDEESIIANTPINVTNKNLNLQNLLLKRSDSLRSSGSELGSGSLISTSAESSKRVSFNNDVRIKRIPVKSKLATTNNGNEVGNPASTPFIATKVTHEAIPPEEVEAETENILKQLEGIECQVHSTYPPKVPNSASEAASEEAKRKADNRLYGLHALNNLDIAVNGKEVNSMPSYQEIRKRENSVSNSGSVNNLALHHSSDSNSNSNSKVPAKPPRRNSPVQRGHTQMTHYATPALIHSDLESVSSDLKTGYRNHSKRLQDSLNAEDSAICSGGDADDSTVTSSYTSRFIRKSPPRQLVSTANAATISAATSARDSRMSPSRTCMTDSEILRSPSEVLYAVSDKYRHQNNELLTNTSSQTDQRPPSRYVSASRPRSAYNYSSREDLVSNDDVGTYSRRSTSENNRYRPKPNPKHHSSRSLDRLQHESDLESNKENSFKTRIQVISPDRQHNLVQNGYNRKPYKTTINTATDNILYRGNSSEHLQYYHYGENGSHYKVPRSGKPVMVNPYKRENGTSPYRNSVQRPQQQFASTKLVRNVENRGGQPGGGRHGPYDHRDRAMHQVVRNRNYSGHSTSPDRGESPERGGYRQPRAPPRSSNNYNMRSPSSSPTRPPRSRSSPTREQVVRRVSSRRAHTEQADRSPSVMTNGSHRRERGAEADRSPSVMNGLRAAHRDRSHESRSQRGYQAPPPVVQDDRLSRFTEYRGEDILMPHAQEQSRDQVGQPQSRKVTDRERGQSLPPGATIENMREFYKSSQYKSMYQLPPSPTRPAPVLDRGQGGTASSASRPRVTSAGPRVSISEGDVTDEGSRSTAGVPPEKIPRHHHRRGGPSPASGSSTLRPGSQASSSKRPAPSPPVAPSSSTGNGGPVRTGGKGLVVRRVVSSERDGGRRAVQQQQPAAVAPSRRMIVGGQRRSSIDNGLDSSFSESEGLNGEVDPPRPWSSLSDDDLEDEIEYVLAVTNGIVDDHHNNHHRQSLLDNAPHRNQMNNHNNDYHDMQSHRSEIMSSVTSRPASMASTATIVHVHTQPPVKIMPAVQRDPSMKRTNSNHVVFHENPTAYHTIIKDKQPMGEFGRRWAASTNHSDIDSDYRRELANSTNTLHQEARTRDGGQYGGGRLSRGSSKTNIRSAVGNGDQNGGQDAEIILRSPSTTDLERSNSAREEERRKVLEIEGVIRPPQMRANVSRSASRASRTAHVSTAGPRGYKPGVPRHLSAGAEMDRESQYSGHSSSQTAPIQGTAKLNRFDQHRVGVGRVRRSTSNANAAAIGGVRREINQRKTKLPGGSLTSSVNSSESEQGSHAGQSAVSRNTNMSNRSVFLHAAAVADIPTAEMTGSRPGGGGAAQRSLSAESARDSNQEKPNNQREHQPPPPPSASRSNLKGSKKISRSISLLAPWKPRPVQDKFEIHYDNGNLYSNPATRVTVEPGNMPPPPAPAASKPPRPPTAPPPPPTNGPPPVRRNMGRGVSESNNKSASSTDLLMRNQPTPTSSDKENTTPAVILAERRAAEAEKKAGKAVSRSVSMPKDSRLAGFFRRRKRVA